MALTNAEKQSRHRARIEAELDAYRVNVRALLDEIQNACERAGCHRFADNLPDDPGEALAVLRVRLQSRKLVVCRADPDE